MTLHRSALLFYLPFPAFYCFILSPYSYSEAHYTFLSFYLMTVQEATLTSYSFTFPSVKSSFFTFNPSPFHVQTASSNRTSPPSEGLGEALFLQPNIPQRGTRHKPIEVHMSLYATHFASFRELPDVMSACTFYLWTTRIVLSKEKKVRIEAWSKM